MRPRAAHLAGVPPLSLVVRRPIIQSEILVAEQTLTDAERRYLEDLRRIPSSVGSRVMGWALELIPSIGLFAYGILANSRFFQVLGFVSLLYFAVWRMYSQFRGFRLLSGIYRKLLAGERPPNTGA